MFWVVAAIVVWTLGEMLAFPLLSAWAADRATDANRGRYMGAMSMSFGAASVIGPVVGAYVYENAGPDVLWLSVGGLAAVVGLALAGLSRAGERA